jgi:outer membrane protein assembly factor BamB
VRKGCPMKGFKFILVAVLLLSLISIFTIFQSTPSAECVNNIRNSKTVGLSGIKQTSLNGSSDTDWWTTFQHDASHSGFSTSNAPDNNSTLWIRGEGRYGLFSPTVSGGIVFAGSNDDNLYAVNETTGLLIWNYTTYGPIDSYPAIDNGKVFFGSYDGNVYALNATNGAFIWNYSTREEGYSPYVQSSPVVANGTVFVGSGNGKMYALDENSGTEKWSFMSETNLVSCPAVVDGVVYFGSDDYNVYALNSSTGAVIWTYKTGAWIWSSPCVADGKVFIGSLDGNLYSLDASTGAFAWSFATGTIQDCPAFYNGILYVGSTGMGLFAINASSGMSIWNFTAGPIYSYTSPTVADGNVFITSYNGTLYALNASTGEEVWSYSTGGTGSCSSAVIADGRIFVTSGNGELYCFGSMLYFDVTVAPVFYDNRGNELYPDSWVIDLPNGSSITPTGPETLYGPMGNYAILALFWKGAMVYCGWQYSTFIDSNETWSPEVHCILPSELTFSTESTTSVLGFMVTLNGNLTCRDMGISEAPILLSYSVTGGASWNDITLVNTATDGSFSVDWIPAATGNYIVRGQWTGNSTFLAITNMLNLAVESYENQYVFTIESNSTISDLTFNSTSHILSFTASGVNGTEGYTRLTIAQSLAPDVAKLTVSVDGIEYNHTVQGLDDSWVLLFTYTHSTHQIDVDLNQSAIPEFPSFLIMSLFMMTMLLATIVFKRRVTKQG